MSEDTRPDDTEVHYLDEVDPDPISIILEIANLVFQPGSLALIGNLASGAGATAAAYFTYRDLNERKKSEIRRALYEVDRALTKGFAGLMTLASLLDEFSFLGNPKRIGGAPIRGFNNAQTLRRTHEDCRAAVKEARDAFIDLSGKLPIEHAETINTTINRLNKLSTPILTIGEPYGSFLVAAALAFTDVDRLICNVGESYEFQREPRDFTEELTRSLPTLRQFRNQLP
jgi:hypothetical protein